MFSLFLVTNCGLYCLDADLVLLHDLFALSIWQLLCSEVYQTLQRKAKGNQD